MVWHIYWWAIIALNVLGVGVAMGKDDEDEFGWCIIKIVFLVPMFILAWKALP